MRGRGWREGRRRRKGEGGGGEEGRRKEERKRQGLVLERGHLSLSLSLSLSGWCLQTRDCGVTRGHC